MHPRAPAQCASQAVTLSSLAVYLDVDRPQVAMPYGVTAWPAMTPEQWDAIFLPASHMPSSSAAAAAPLASHALSLSCAVAAPATGRAAAAGAGGAVGLGLVPGVPSLLHQHTFLVRPVSGSLRYTRRCVHGRPAATPAPPHTAPASVCDA